MRRPQRPLTCVCVCVREHMCAYMRECARTQLLSRVPLFTIPQTVARQAPLSVGFSRQEHCSGLLFPTPGDLRAQGISTPSLASPALAGGFSTTCHWEAP